ncbi:protein CcmA [Parelusimicrobium proximum]|uniref:bactofilin family protein n=1 Tax=Parelusimicrobium proximum TaxID=3228953 RepID=UPI003D167C1A
MNFLKKGDFESGEHISVISAECFFQGTLNVQGSLRIDGKLLGSIDNAKHVVVGEHGKVEGDITAKNIIVSGEVEGNICADNLEVLSTSRITGDIRSKNIVVEGGARIKGQLHVEEAAAESSTETPVKAKN